MLKSQKGSLQNRTLYQLNKVMQILKADYIQITNQFYENQYCIEFSVRLREADRVITELKKITSVIVQCKK